MSTAEYSVTTKQHFANLKDYLESQIYEMDVTKKYGNLRTTFLSVEETPTGSRTNIDFHFSKSPKLSLTRTVRGTNIEWSVREESFLGLSNIVSHDEFLEDLTTKLLISMIKDRPNRSRLTLDHTSTKLSR